MNKFLALLILALIMIPGCTTDENIIGKPNILFISIDDLNDWTGYLGGHPQSETPNLDSFAEKAIYFTNSYCSNPACNPSRTAIMTGYAPHTSGVYSNYQDWREVIPERKTIGQYFRENGYYSAGAGKIFHYHMIDSACWDEYWPSQLKNMPDEYLPNKPKRKPEVNGLDETTSGTINMPAFENMYMMFDWASLNIADSVMGDYKSVKWVSEKLQEEHSKPFFLACGIYRPHLPWYVPKEYFDMFPLKDIQLPKIIENDLDDLGERIKDIASRAGNYHMHVTEAGLWKDAIQGYLASIAYADAMFGLLIDALDRSPYADNTIVVVWSDHGWQLGEKEHWRKFALWENVLRTNLIIRVPDGLSGFESGFHSGSCNRIVSLQDIYPTLIDLCGLPPRDDIDGNSLVPLLKDPGSEWDKPAISSYDYSEFSVRTEKWRYTIYIDGSEELYDHENDSEEWHNLAGFMEYDDILVEMRKHLPGNPAPLVKTSQQLQPHHTPPFATKEEYQFWLNNGKSYPELIKRYWNNETR